jgi:tetraacyldisaccharide 4'-kinase
VTLAEILLTPFSWVYSGVARARAAAYRSGILQTQRLPGTVISVGNLTTGGTGKTPMVLWIAEQLVAGGRRVGILTRGYRGARESDHASHAEAGATGTVTSDEVRILKSRLGDSVAFGVGASRYEQGLRLARWGIDTFVLDDGFQHMRLARNTNIVLVDATNPFGGGRVLPAGRLREPRSALSRADIVVITRAAASPAIEAVVRRHCSAPIFYVQMALEAVQEIGGAGNRIVPPVGPETRWFVFSGIGNPSAFATNLKEWNFSVAGTKTYPDHHKYTPADIREISSAALAAGATKLICTEKDRFNLPPGAEFGMPVYFCSIAVEPNEALWKAITDQIGSPNTGAR